MSLGSLPLLERLAPCRRILLAGAGGGFDVMAGLPLWHYLRSEGREVFLASLSFSDLSGGGGQRARGSTLVRADFPSRESYFPERLLSQWFAGQGMDVPVYCFSPTGVVSLREIYLDLVRELGLDAIVLVDGGTDSLLRGDEPQLGSPAEDVVSIAAVSTLELPVRLLVNLGFGVDYHHGVCHGYVLEAVAELSAQGAFLGAFSLLPSMPEFAAFADALKFVCDHMPGQESIVMTSVVAAAQGRFGNFHPTARTGTSNLFINPLMSMYWGFEVDAVARRCLYTDYLLDTFSRWDVHRALHNFLYTVKPREWLEIPL